MAMIKYFFKANNLSFLDVDISSDFEVSLFSLINLYKTNKRLFVNGSVHKIVDTDIRSLRIIYNRSFDVAPQYCFSTSSVLILSILCNTNKSIDHAHKILLSIDNKDKFDLVQALSGLSVSINNDTSDVFNTIVKAHVLDVLTSLKRDEKLFNVD